MLNVYIGNLGSSKTTNAVRDMVLDNSGLPTYTNIRTKDIPKVTFMGNDTILKKEVTLVGKKEKEKLVFNRDVWLALPKPCNIIFDEFHFIGDSRESTSQKNRAITEFISMARRIIGFDKYGYGDFTMLVQRLNTIDLRIRELITTIIYHILRWTFYCENCGWGAHWSSEKENKKYCSRCQKRTLTKHHMWSERFYFKSEDDFYTWKLSNGRIRAYYKKTRIADISSYFEYFDTLQYLRSEKGKGELSEQDHISKDTHQENESST